MLPMWTAYPELLVIGGTLDGVNSFGSLNVNNMTGGVYSAASLLKGNNSACFVFQLTQILVPDAPSALADIVDAIVSQTVGAIAPILAGLTCPELTSLDRSMLEHYPGYTWGLTMLVLENSAKHVQVSRDSTSNLVILTGMLLKGM
ncbi:hypothetical protein DFH07DRAFT_963586 [Mycena maculata]|uniref:Uncharacterized protein n=1 Tax=Mycena maculata TaxID=230809 RepID=A0AAD7N428_9AGAR|nr:hypothetical protein DFH07DRAFT_963586 [Mycena maculata]